MTNFVEFQQKAEQLVRRLSCNATQQSSCFSFFSALLPNRNLNDAFVISEVAKSLSYDDTHLMDYLQRFKNKRIATKLDVEEYKTCILKGCYLLKWVQYESSVLSYISTSLIKLFQSDLGIEFPRNMDENSFNFCLDAFSHYCSFIYKNRREVNYADLNKLLGIKIQIDIGTVRYSKPSNTSWYDFCSRIAQ